MDVPEALATPAAPSRNLFARRRELDLWPRRGQFREIIPLASRANGDEAVELGRIRHAVLAGPVVPGRADLSIDIRDVDAEVIEQLVDHTHATLEGLEAERGVTVTVDRPYDVPPTDMSADCRDAFHAAADAVGVEAMDLHSGAGHDTMQTARATDAGLLFAPSEGGHSHSPLEWTSWADCATTTEILATALGDLAGATTP